MSKVIYKCEKCEKEFTDHYDCNQHEIECLNKQDIINVSLEKAIEHLRNKYPVTFTKYSAQIYTWDCDGFVNENSQFEINGFLSNGHEIDFCEYYYASEASAEDFISFIENELIIPHLDTTYEGTIHNNMECEWQLLGEHGISIDELCRRLNGKYVKIEVINEN